MNINGYPPSLSPEVAIPGLLMCDGIYYAQLLISGAQIPARIALHGAATEDQARKALQILGRHTARSSPSPSPTPLP